MMIVKTILRKLIHALKGIEDWAEDKKSQGPQETIKKEVPAEITEVQSIWDYILPKENTQANHLITTIGFEEWVEMQEIKRRIKELFGMDYKNERSLYPYVKTLADCGLFEFSDIGGKRKWKKKALLLKLKNKATQEQKETEKQTAKSNYSEPL